MKIKKAPLIAIGALVLTIILVVIFGLVLGRERPSTEIMDLTEYFGTQKYDDIVTFIDEERAEVDITVKDGRYYLPLHDAKNLNDRIYWDYNEKLAIYITNDNVLKFYPGDREYYENNNKKEMSYVAIYDEGEEPLVALDFIEEYTATVRHREEVLPNRLFITTVWDEPIDYIDVKNDNKIRFESSLQSPILSDAIKGDKLMYLGAGDEWTEVQTDVGVRGFIENKYLEEESYQESVSAPADGYTENFSHILFDGKVNMLWHQVWGTSVNAEIRNVLSNSPGVNVVGPTWFYLNDNEGNFASKADLAYVDTCHNAGVKVWATFNNIDNPDIDTTYVLTNTSVRENMENQIIVEALNNRLDGVNLDFEAVKSSTDDAFVQFVRELAVKCHANGLVLSVDNLVPMDFSAFYRRGQQAQFADYICVMAYDEHYNGSEAGSIASLGFVKSGVENTIADGVPANQLILGVPFYTRIWFVKDDGETTSETASMVDARNAADNNGASFVWDDEVSQYYCEYVRDGVTRRIWAEDAKSIREKLKVMEDNNLAGAAFWKAGLETSDVWGAIGEFFNGN